jgi:peptidoglycan/xylan/chitin deacetylase (PgdA/CDA1 family)
LVRLFDTANIPLTFFVTGFALQQNPEFAEYLKNSRHEVAGHGWRWIDYSQVSKEEEKDHILLTQDTLSSLTEKNIRGWYTGRRSQHTRNLLKEIGHCVYDSDDYSDDYPYFEDKHLIIPYSLVTNDFRYLTTPGFSNPNDFYQLLKSSFDALYQEGRGAILNIGLHARVSGHPGRSIAINQFIEYLKTFSNIWITTREAIAHHWLSKR